MGALSTARRWRRRCGWSPPSVMKESDIPIRTFFLWRAPFSWVALELIRVLKHVLILLIKKNQTKNIKRIKRKKRNNTKGEH
jgi:hypothetical protein